MQTQAPTNVEAIRASDKLGGRWRLWEGYPAGKHRGGDYMNTMKMIYPIETVGDLAHLFKNTSYGTPSKFFFCIQSQKMKRYTPDGFLVKVSLAYN